MVDYLIKLMKVSKKGNVYNYYYYKLDSLNIYFSKFGVVKEIIIKKDQNKKSRGFGFIIFSNVEGMSNVLAYPNHIIEGKVIEIKQAVNCKNKKLVESKKAFNYKTKQTIYYKNKVFVGGIGNLTEETLFVYFSKFGMIVNILILQDQLTGKRRGFGYVQYENESSVEKLLSNTVHYIDDKKIECKRSFHKSMMKEEDVLMNIISSNHYSSINKTYTFVNENDLYNNKHSQYQCNQHAKYSDIYNDTILHQNKENHSLNEEYKKQNENNNEEYKLNDIRLNINQLFSYKSNTKNKLDFSDFHEIINGFYGNNQQDECNDNQYYLFYSNNEKDDIKEEILNDQRKRNLKFFSLF